MNDEDRRVARRVGELSDAAYALAAVASALRRADAALDPAHARVLATLGLAEARDGGWILAPALARTGFGLAERLATVLSRAAAAAEGRHEWVEQDLATKIALGRTSGAAGRWMVTGLARQLDGLAARLAVPDAEALDVGTGVGEIAVAMAEAAPSLRVVGIDVLDDVLGIARTTLASRGLAERVTLRRQDVAAFADVAAYDLVYLPAYFIPEEALAAALPRLVVALRPGGWLVVPAHEASDSELGRAVADWRRATSGCPDRTPEETARELRRTGLDGVQVVAVHPLLPAVVAGRAREG